MFGSSERNRCPACGSLLKRDAALCPACGYELKVRKDAQKCPNCGALVPDTDVACPICGTERQVEGVRMTKALTIKAAIDPAVTHISFWGLTLIPLSRSSLSAIASRSSK